MQSRNNTCSLLHAHVAAPGIENHVGACLEAFFKAYIEMGGIYAGRVLFTATGTVFNLFSLGRSGPARERKREGERDAGELCCPVFKEFSTC